MSENKSKLESKAKRMIKHEYVAWLTTVGTDLTPQPRPVWFVWDRGTFLIFSQPEAYKVRHLMKNPAVSLHFNTDPSGDQDVIVYTGTARIDSIVPPAHKVSSYFRKYREGIKALGMTPEQFSSDYSVAIRVKPATLRGW